MHGRKMTLVFRRSGETASLAGDEIVWQKVNQGRKYLLRLKKNLRVGKELNKETP